MHLTPRLRADAITFRVGTSYASRYAPRALLARGRRALSGLVLALLLSLCAVGTRAEAGSDLPVLGPDALNGGRYVASALGAERLSLRFAGTIGYGFTESVLAEDDQHHRVAGELALALVVAPWLQVALGGELRVDMHTPEGAGGGTGLLGSSQLVTRHWLSLGRGISLGLSPRMIFPGAESVSRGFRAASYELLALFSARLPLASELALHAGYRFDRTQYAVENASELAEPQRLAASMSDQNAYLLGALLSMPLRAFRLAGEWSWELQTGGHVHARESPMRLRAILQRVLGERFLPGIEVGVNASPRPTFVGLTRIEPRVWVRLSLGVVLARKPPSPAPAPAPAPAPSAVVEVAPPAPILRAVMLRVLDPSGQPVAGARIAVPRDGEQDEYTTDAQGNVTLQVPAGVTAVTIEAEGYEPLWRTLGREPKQETAVMLKPGLPPGEIKGMVRNLAGDPLRATVTVLPQAMTVSTDARGQFAIGVAPGDYTLKIVADGYEPQERRAQVEVRGVTIIVVDLRKATK
jgi:Carboxypeptidase regulatory-like domain